jgi:hypothetical protein
LDEGKKMADTERMARLLTEFNMGTAMTAAFVLYILEKKGLLNKAEVDEAIREAAEMVPDEHAGAPRLAPLVSLRVLLDDPAMRHTTPFPWRPD